MAAGLPFLNRPADEAFVVNTDYSAWVLESRKLFRFSSPFITSNEPVSTNIKLQHIATMNGPSGKIVPGLMCQWPANLLFQSLNERATWYGDAAKLQFGDGSRGHCFSVTVLFSARASSTLTRPDISRPSAAKASAATFCKEVAKSVASASVSTLS